MNSELCNNVKIAQLYDELSCFNNTLKHPAKLPDRSDLVHLGDTIILQMMRKIIEASNNKAYEITDSPEFYNIHLMDKLPTDIWYILAKNNITTIADLITLDDTIILNLKQIGSIRYAAIKKFMKIHGLVFKKDIRFFNKDVEGINLINEFMNSNIPNTESFYNSTVKLNNEDAFVLIIEKINALQISLSSYSKKAPLFKNYMDEHLICEELILYKELELDTIPIESTKNAKPNLLFNSLTITTEKTYNISNEINRISNNIFAKTTKNKSNNSVFIKYTVSSYIPLSNGYIFGYNIENLEIEM